MTDVIQRVLEERKRQNEKWGEQNHNEVEWIAILGEEYGEASKEAVDFHFCYKGSQEQPAILERLKTELIQTAAVAIQIVECIERKQKIPHN